MFTNVIREMLNGLIMENEWRTQTFLGDRNYIGMSDVGKAFGCVRQAVASKAFPDKLYPTLAEVEKMSDEQVLKAFERIRPLERGHEQEVGIVSALNRLGYHHVEQLEIRVKHEGVDVAVHLDHTLFGENSIHVIESKSNENIPDELYLAYYGQIMGQIGFLERYFDKPVFSVKDDAGKLLVHNKPLPVLVEKLTGLRFNGMPKITGQVLSMSGDSARPFGPFMPDDMTTDLVLRKAKFIWEMGYLVKHGMADLANVEYAQGFYPLCDYCAYSADCPKYTDQVNIPEMNGAIHILKELQVKEKEVKAAIQIRKSDLADAYDAMGLDGRGYVNAGDFRMRNRKQSRNTVQSDPLKEQLSEIFEVPTDFLDRVFNACTKTTSYTVLDIAKVAKTKVVEETQKAAA